MPMNVNESEWKRTKMNESEWKWMELNESNSIHFWTWIYFTGLRKVYPYYFTFTTFTKGRWVGEKILDVFAREFRAHPVEEYVSVSSSYSGLLLLADHPRRFLLIKMERVNESNCGWHGLLLFLTLGQRKKNPAAILSPSPPPAE